MSVDEAPITLTATTPDGAALRVLVEGEGAPLLLVSGLGGTAGFWTPAARLLGRSFRVIRFDQRGIGASTRGKATCTIDQLATDCLTVLDAVGVGACTMLGHSTGGCIGQSLARQAPQRLDGLVLSATWLRPSRYMDALFRTRRAVLAHDPEAYAATAALLAYPPAWLEENWSHFEAAVASAPATDAAAAIVGERIDALLAFDGSADAAAIPAPTLVLGAEDDMIVPAFQQRALAAALPSPLLVMLPSGGHFFPTTRTAAFVDSVTAWMGAAA